MHDTHSSVAGACAITSQGLYTSINCVIIDAAIFIIIYVLINMLVCMLSPKKYAVQLTTAVSIVFIVIALIAFYTDPSGVSMRSFERLLVYALGTMIVVFFSAIPILISTIINSIIWRGIRKVPR